MGCAGANDDLNQNHARNLTLLIKFAWILRKGVLGPRGCQRSVRFRYNPQYRISRYTMALSFNG